MELPEQLSMMAAYWAALAAAMAAWCLLNSSSSEKQMKCFMKILARSFRTNPAKLKDAQKFEFFCGVWNYRFMWIIFWENLDRNKVSNGQFYQPAKLFPDPLLSPLRLIIESSLRAST